ncbi:tubulin complex component 2 [Seminavis robusta]|uniref:Tubulin complex component 2 n=1 Tax=Seminavis robusta TaxID=568900 RepID=A0A9N8D9W5_9STRA|nr:tubulin complex component 2 [Seminavis robusta]|eukprot:Sro50_g029000.1 tubulin complex component 2 (1340) ;mRNA; r:50457-54703
MASLRRDTPAGRAALARRRQRAAAVVDHSSRFANEEGLVDGTGAPTSISQNLGQHQHHSAASSTSGGASVDAPDSYSQHQQQRTIPPSHQAQPQPASAVDIQSPDKLLARSAQVAQAAASVLASVRKSRQPPPQAVNTSFVSEEETEEDAVDYSYSHQPQQESFYEMPGYNPTTEATNIASQLLAAKRHNTTTRLRQQQQQQQQRTPNNPRGYQPSRDDTDDEQEEQQQSSNQQQQVERRQGDGETMEDLEPLIVSSEDPFETIDSCTLSSGSIISLRSVATSATVTASIQNQNNNNSEESIAVVAGAGLGAPEEIFQIVKINTPTSSSSSHQTDASLDPSSALLRWGDTIALVSPHLVDPANEKPMALGIKRTTSTATRQAPHIGWFRSTRGPSELWTVLRGPDRLQTQLRIGLASLQSARILAQNRAKQGALTRLVHSGDPILLRHNETGGLLSMSSSSSNNNDGSLVLLSDAYEAPQGAVMDSMTQLQRNNSPRDSDTFVLLESSVPPCPRWILGGGTSSSCNTTYNPIGHRMYLHQTFTAEPNRNGGSNNLQKKLFATTARNTMAAAAAAQHNNNVNPKMMKLEDQERILLDEVIGACLGLEGKFIRTKRIPVQHDDDEEMNGLTAIMTPEQLEFGFAEENDSSFFDSGLGNLARQVLPLATAYTHVSAFLGAHQPGYEYGSVMQAFCEALEAILKEYVDFVGTMEQQLRQPAVQEGSEGGLTLQRLHTHLMPSLETMSLLKRVTVAVKSKAGGALLNCLASIKSMSCEGDVVANKVLSFLLDRSSIPYMGMLTTWLQYGLLKDPYKEFMIEVRNPIAGGGHYNGTSKRNGRPDLSEESFVLKDENVLSDLETSGALIQKVAATGKYRRAVRICQSSERKTAPLNSEEEQNGGKPKFLLRYGLDFNSLSSFIQSMYEGASRALQYFLLGHGDFLDSFLDSAEDELVKDLGDISSGRIQHWLRTAVQLTNKADRHTKQSKQTTKTRPSLTPLALRCRFVPISLIQHVDSVDFSGDGEISRSNKESAREDSLLGTPLRDAVGISNKGLTGVETFLLEYPSVPFPLSLVLKESALDSYQLLFRLLFFAKYAERRLLGIWQDHMQVKELSSVRGLFGQTFLLRQRMLHFAQNLIYYFVFEVIEPNWHQMEETIGSPSKAYRRTVDDLVAIHNTFLRSSLEACLLTNRELVRTLSKILTTCLMFADQMKLFTEATRIYDDSSLIAVERREAIQRSLNDRGSGGTKHPVDKSAVREALSSFKQDRQVRLKKQKRRVGRELASESYRRMVGRFEEVFSAYLSEFMTQLNGDVGTSNHTHQTNLSSRLDYNGFLFSSVQNYVN